jgi:hypothetical protein
MHARHLLDVLNLGQADKQRGIHRQIVGHEQMLLTPDFRQLRQRQAATAVELSP